MILFNILFFWYFSSRRVVDKNVLSRVLRCIWGWDSIREARWIPFRHVFFLVELLIVVKIKIYPWICYHDEIISLYRHFNHFNNTDCLQHLSHRNSSFFGQSCSSWWEKNYSKKRNIKRPTPSHRNINLRDTVHHFSIPKFDNIFMLGSFGKINCWLLS